MATISQFEKCSDAQIAAAVMIHFECGFCSKKIDIWLNNMAEVVIQIKKF